MSDDWVQRGLCRSERSKFGGIRQVLGVFYPEPGETGMRFRLICHVCPVECECRLWGILAEDYGAWGGTDEQERREMRRDIADGVATLADILRDGGCGEVADRIEEEDAVAQAEAAQELPRPG